MEREEGVAIPELLLGALAFYRAPQRYAQLRDPRQPLPAGVTELLAAGAQALAPEHEADTAARLGSSPNELHDAQLFFIRQALLEAGGDHYRTLGVAPDAGTALIRQHYHYLIRLFHPDRDLDNEGWDTLYAPAINEAWNVLRHPDKRAAYDAGLRTRVSAVEAAWQAVPSPQAPPSTLHAAPRRGVQARARGRSRGLPRAGWFGLGALLVVPVVLALLVMRERSQPVLRIAPAATETRPGPSRERPVIASGASAREAAPQARTADSAAVEERVPAGAAQPVVAVMGPERAQATAPAAVAAAPPPAAVTHAPDLPALQRAELDALMREFAASYEAGDAQRFAALFSEEAVTTDARGREAIRAHYQAFFARPESRRMRLQRLRWHDYGPHRSGGTARADILTRPFDGGATAHGVLKLSIVVEQSPQGPSITGLHYQ